jgi:hypothetical protein
MLEIKFWQLLLWLRVRLISKCPQHYHIYSPTDFNSYCGSGDAFCGKGCDPIYGVCQSVRNSAAASSTTSLRPSPQPTPTSKVIDASCSPVPVVSTGVYPPFNYRRCIAKEGLKCYGLPYGGLGILSDVLTIYTVIMLSLGRRPYLPWLQLKGGYLDVGLAVVSVLGTVASAIVTIAHCSKAHWSFALLATWRMMLSMSFALMTGHAALIRRDEISKYDTIRIGRWLLFYAIGLALGMAGLFYISFINPGPPDSSRTSVDWTPFAIFMAALIGGSGASIISWAFGLVYKGRKWNKHLLIFQHDPWVLSALYRPWASFLICYAMYFGLLMVFASDWILASIANNYSGYPSSNSELSYPLAIAYQSN